MLRPILLLAVVPFAAGDPPLPELGAFNEHVLAVLRTYPTDGTHRYHWPKKGDWGGNTRDLHYRGELLAAGDPERRAFCCGLTFEVFVRAWERWAAAEGHEAVVPGMRDAGAMRALRRQWFGSDGDVTCSSHAIADNGLGVHVAKLADARPGDFVQLWRHSGSGHSVVFVDWVYEGEDTAAVLARARKSEPRAKEAAGEITGICYWSTQKATNGIGYRVERFGGERGVDPQRLHVARIGAEPKKGRAKRGERDRRQATHQ